MNVPKTVQILTTPEAGVSSLLGLYDTLNAAGRDWQLLVSGGPLEPVFDVQLVGPSRDPFSLGGGIQFQADATFDDAPQADLIVVPGLTLPPDQRINPLDHPGIDWIRRRAQRGSRVVSACTGAIYLAEAGLLDNIEATSHWAFGDVFQKYYPNVRLRLDRSLCFADASEGIVTSGGTTGWHELALFLIANYGSTQNAARTAKIWLIADRGELQAPYSSMQRMMSHEDTRIADAQSWVAENYATENPVAGMTGAANLPATSFARRFKAATGKTPKAYVQAMRIEEARQLLETTTDTVADIAAEVGYQDTASFRRLFKRQTGITPKEHRQMFGQQRFARYS